MLFLMKVLRFFYTLSDLLPRRAHQRQRSRHQQHQQDGEEDEDFRFISWLFSVILAAAMLDRLTLVYVSAVRQYADICLFNTAQYKCPVAVEESE